uniref:Peptidase S1 domain-containing protein n=1 Tax=Anser brachyrhynchus TaxID=132585 RepID=A0A8B9CIN3_9AVES
METEEPPLTRHIRGGWPWQVSLRLKGFHRDTRLLCGATLISSCWVVTAAHCFKSLVRGVKDEFERELPVERIVLHRNYWAGSNDNDIALVRMRGREGHCLYFNHHVLPVCLPDRREKSDINRQACIISGWGDTGDFSSHSILLKMWERGMLPPGHSTLASPLLCAFLPTAKPLGNNLCQGDSGGPLMCQRSNGRWIILGITSWGYGCGRKDSPGVYTKVSKYVPWIKKVTNGSQDMLINGLYSDCVGLGLICNKGTCSKGMFSFAFFWCFFFFFSQH